MVYFLGRDVDVYITTETTNNGAYIDGGHATENTIVGTSGSGDIVFAASLDATLGGAGAPTVTNLTGVDLSIGSVDEDITYFGFRSVTKAEIKKETTISLTRKKTDSAWDVVFDQGRYGSNASASFTANALTEPTTVTGYRIHVVLRTGSIGSSPTYDEVFTVPACCVQSHSTSINADGVGEETIEFMSYVEPNIGAAAYQTALTDSEL